MRQKVRAKVPSKLYGNKIEFGAYRQLSPHKKTNKHKIKHDRCLKYYGFDKATLQQSSIHCHYCISVEIKDESIFAHGCFDQLTKNFP